MYIIITILYSYSQLCYHIANHACIYSGQLYWCTYLNPSCFRSCLSCLYIAVVDVSCLATVAIYVATLILHSLMYACSYMCVSVCVYVYLYVSMQACVFVYVYVQCTIYVGKSCFSQSYNQLHSQYEDQSAIYYCIVGIFS